MHVLTPAPSQRHRVMEPPIIGERRRKRLTSNGTLHTLPTLRSADLGYFLANRVSCCNREWVRR